MSDQEIKSNLCYYDRENPNNDLGCFEEEDRPEPRENCYCDNCFYGRDKLAMQILETQRERDEARNELEDYKASTIHSCNEECKRPMCVLRRQRREAREDAEHWKTEYLIVAARLCGKKHPRDNGIISEHEIIPKLERERDEAREKAERYRLEANAMMLQRDEAQKHLRDIEEYGTEEINAAVELRQKLADALLERDEARELADRYRAAFCSAKGDLVPQVFPWEAK